MLNNNLQQRAARRLRDSFATIQAVALDLDGVLTDGRITWSHTGEEQRTFSAQDILGLMLLGRAGVQTAIISSSNSAQISRIAENLRVPFVIAGSKDKAAALLKFAEQLTLSAAAIGYLGDDLDDLPAMEACGLCACPSTAVAEVAHYVGTHGFVSSRPGGAGAVREFAEALLNARKLPLRDVALMQ